MNIQNAQCIIKKIKKFQSGTRLDQAMVMLFPEYSRSQIKKMIISGFVKLNERTIINPDIKVLSGEYIELNFTFKKIDFFLAQDISLNIVYEDDFILVINKPHNFVVHPGPGNFSGTVLNALLYYFPDISQVSRAGIVHRLDKDTTGLMIVAKKEFVRNRLIKLFKLRKIYREYEAIVSGKLTSNGVINQPICRHFSKRTYMNVHYMGKSAITHYSILEKFRYHTRIKLRLYTGRTHQIRVHMAYINHPIFGDQKYGYKSLIKSSNTSLNNSLLNFNRQALHSINIRFYHPVTDLFMQLNAPLPQDMQKLIEDLRNDVCLINH